MFNYSTYASIEALIKTTPGIFFPPFIKVICLSEFLQMLLNTYVQLSERGHAPHAG